eukprot:TRINITY_DN175_c0_g1_i3.p1 TRINITY_DN175_c0_g1~~TRINITY_DN175_c0_g1_i3.p1  ORF type:complete len:223 (+),score=63.32 TRINITY_DN175_c0_g1_i3:101-670(+)
MAFRWASTTAAAALAVVAAALAVATPAAVSARPRLVPFPYKHPFPCLTDLDGSCVYPRPTPTPTPAPTLPPRGCQAAAARSDAYLYGRLTGGRTIGGCRIVSSTTGACKLYAKSAIPGVRGDKGHPKNVNNDGTGCVGSATFCYFRRAEYVLTPAERDDMCTADATHNAVAQLRHAFRNGACGKCEFSY